MKKQLFRARLLSLAALCGIAMAFASCSNEDVAQDKTTGTDDNADKNLTAFVTGTEATRTTMDYPTGNFFWEAGDKIYVKDDDGTWQVSSNAPTAKTAYFKFKVPGKFNNHTSYKVYYPGKNGSNNQVTIPAAQSQAEPNSTAHFGVSGDCGTADATGPLGGKSFNFTLDHQAAILVFQPYTSNTVLKDCYLTKIEVSSDNDITDTYTLDETSGEITGTGTGKQIILTTSGGWPYYDGFPLTNSAASVTTNGSYMLIKPGTHTLKIRYWIKDLMTNVEGTFTKTLPAHTFDKNKYYPITANLDVRNYDGDHYYQWDAQKQYWDGYEWTKHLPGNTGQPTLFSGSSPNYPQNNSDPRYHSEDSPGWFINTPATHDPCKDMPNANEMSWYAMKGDPRGGGDEVWTTMGHLYKGGIWFLKKAYIQDFSTEHAYDNTDWRISIGTCANTSISSGLPSAADANKYFFLPFIGYYLSGAMQNFAAMGSYWSSTGLGANPDGAYCMNVDGSQVVVTTNFARVSGLRAQPSLFK